MKKSLLIPLRYGTKRLRVATQIADPFMERPTAQRYDKGYRPAAFAVLAREVEEKDLITARTDRRFSGMKTLFPFPSLHIIHIIEQFVGKCKGFLKIFAQKAGREALL